MDSLMMVLWVCIAVPVLLSLILVEKKSRAILGFIVIGMTVCTYASQVNGLFSVQFEDTFYLTTAITPVTEELLKALPVLFYAFVISDKRERLLGISMALGIGFAIMENAFMLAGMGGASFVWALFRALGAGLMHGLCTAAIGYGMSFVHKKKKLFFTGTFALFAFACIYHSIYNMLVQSSFGWLAIIFTLLTFGTGIIWIIKYKNKTKIERKG